MKHFHDETMEILDSFIEAEEVLQSEEVSKGLKRFEQSLNSMVIERNDRLEREVRDALGRHGAETGNYGPLNRFAEMI